MPLAPDYRELLALPILHFLCHNPVRSAVPGHHLWGGDLELLSILSQGTRSNTRDPHSSPNGAETADAAFHFTLLGHHIHLVSETASGCSQ